MRDNFKGFVPVCCLCKDNLTQKCILMTKLLDALKKQDEERPMPFDGRTLAWATTTAIDYDQRLRDWFAALGKNHLFFLYLIVFAQTALFAGSAIAKTLLPTSKSLHASIYIQRQLVSFISKDRCEVSFYLP